MGPDVETRPSPPRGHHEGGLRSTCGAHHRGGPHAELALRFADAIARHHDATVVVLHLVPPGITLAVRAQAERALAAFIKQHISGRSEAVFRAGPLGLTRGWKATLKRRPIAWSR